MTKPTLKNGSRYISVKYFITMLQRKVLRKQSCENVVLLNDVFIHLSNDCFTSKRVIFQRNEIQDYNFFSE